MGLTKPTNNHLLLNSLVHVDDLHWYDFSSKHTQIKALQSADVVFSTYADVIAVLYPEIFIKANNKPLVWIPHGTTPQFFLRIRMESSSTSINNAVLLSG
jgi:hypothetical protein